MEHIFQSPNLGFKPQKRENMTCDVYVYNDKVYATNFVNLYKSKSEDMFPIIGLIVALLIVAFIIIIATIF